MQKGRRKEGGQVTEVLERVLVENSFKAMVPKIGSPDVPGLKVPETFSTLLC